jgi:hypothetical protein
MERSIRRFVDYARLGNLVPHSQPWHDALKTHHVPARLMMRFNAILDTGCDLLELWDCSCGSTLSLRGIGPLAWAGDGYDEPPILDKETT